MRRATRPEPPPPLMRSRPTAADLAKQAIETLDLQQSFFKSRPGSIARGELLEKAKHAERTLRDWSERVLEQPNLFD